MNKLKHIRIYKTVTFKPVWILICALLTLGIFLMPTLILASADCQQAKELFQRSINEADPGTKRVLLEKAVTLCPGHALSWNNLGLIYENEEEFDKAKKAYRKAMKYQPDLAAPLAGLGDIAMAQGHFQDAADWFKRFLDSLSQKKNKDDPYGLYYYKDEYQEKYKLAKLRRQIHEGSISGVVSSDILVRGLRGIRTKKPDKTVTLRGFKVIKLTKPIKPERVTLSVLFEFDSAEIKQQGQEQLREMAQAMCSHELSAQKVLIEGYTDSIGTEEYNIDLSRRRAKVVRSFLISNGVEPHGLEIKGCGESNPIVPFGDMEAQSINRRVEFVTSKGNK